MACNGDYVLMAAVFEERGYEATFVLNFCSRYCSNHTNDFPGEQLVND